MLIRAFTSGRNVAKDNNYLEVNRRRIKFFQEPDYHNKNCSEIVSVNKNNDHYKSMKEWSVVSFFLLIVGVMGYVLVNSKASADQEEAEDKIGDNSLQSQEGLNAITTQLSEMLPSPIENYVDLQNKRELLDERLKGKDIVLISGAGGMGKSTLAVQYGNECKQRGDGEVIWIKGTQIEEEFFRLAGALGVKTNGLSSEMIRNLVYGNLEARFEKKRILFIFDNVETKERIEKYLINLPRTGKVIITARNEDLLEGIQPIRIKGFKKEEGSFYLREAIKTSKEEAETIITVVGESPFRLSVIVAYLKTHHLISVSEFLEIYLRTKKGHSQNAEIYPEVEMLFRNLKKDSPKAWELLKYLAYMDAEGVSIGLIADITNQTIKELEESVSKIRELSLVKANERKVKVTHRIIQEETKKALIEEDSKQVLKILKKLIIEIEKIFPKVTYDPENWETATELVNHARILIQEAKERNLAVDTQRKNLLEKV